jgi:NAD(P)-dependent dehydrogenase (short-subunit alcohol dehydrogenase family)
VATSPVNVLSPFRPQILLLTMSHANSRVWFGKCSRMAYAGHVPHTSSITVTGSSQGIGRAILDAVLAANERVVATLRNPSKLASYAEKYPSSQLLILPLDVTSIEQIDAAFTKVKEHFGRLDVVVNNAGYGLVGEVEIIPEDEARLCFETCFWGTFHICQRVCALSLH